MQDLTTEMRRAKFENGKKNVLAKFNLNDDTSNAFANRANVKECPQEERRWAIHYMCKLYGSPDPDEYEVFKDVKRKIIQSLEIPGNSHQSVHDVMQISFNCFFNGIPYDPNLKLSTRGRKAIIAELDHNAIILYKQVSYS